MVLLYCILAQGFPLRGCCICAQQEERQSIGGRTGCCRGKLLLADLREEGPCACVGAVMSRAAVGSQVSELRRGAWRLEDGRSRRCYHVLCARTAEGHVCMCVCVCVE